ncbi:MAG: polysaccharide lyase family 7 protein [Verrucomicrobiales bacterium]|nr:polysaccharide lyase family 7 protein [Verrucomicrobiales bacterium]
MRFLIPTVALFIFAASADAKNVAGDMFNLGIWKLTIPMDDDGDGVADEVTMPLLRYFEDPDFFHLSETGDSVVFRAVCGGATTKNSSYPRSELREMKKDSKTKASWSTTSGVHNMTVEFAINKVPKKKQHVVAAQIHDEENDLVMVRLEGKKLFLERHEEEDFMLVEDYKLGTFVKLMIIADNGRIRFFLGGKQLLEWKVEAEGLYFKVGCYTQSNPEKGDKPDDYGETEFRSVYVMHK